MKQTITSKELEALAKGYGYTLLCVEKEEQGTFVSLTPSGEYAAEIYTPSKRDADRPYEVQTCAYGAKSSDEIKKMIKGYQNALLMIDALERTDLDVLEAYNIREDGEVKA